MPISLKAMKNKVDQMDDANLSSGKEDVSSGSNKELHDIAVIGMACRFAGADDVDEYWNMLVHGTDSIYSFPENRRYYVGEFLKRQSTYDKQAKYYEAGFLKHAETFDNDVFHISNLDASLMSMEQRNFLEVAWQAIEDSGYGGDQTKEKDVGVFVGTSTDFGGCYKDFVCALNPEMTKTAITGNVNSIIASRISYIFNWNGPAMNVDTACSSSLTAIHYACASLRSGDCSMAIAGSCKIINLAIEEDRKQHMLDVTSKDGRTRAFDLEADGTGLGEGSGVIVLKPLCKARQDGDHIYAVIKGDAINQDGQSANLTAPSPVAQTNLLVRAWKDAQVKPETISYIEAHGTGTKLGDPIEITSITNAFRKFTEKRQFCAIGSVKTNIGHLDHAAGMAAIIKAILCLQHKKLVPSIHYRKPNQNIDFENTPTYVNTKYCDWEVKDTPRRCGVSAFGLAGTNCHVVLEEAPAEEQDKTNAGELHILTLSAMNKQRLLDYVWSYQKYLFHHADINVSNLCYTANVGRTQYTTRLAVVFETVDDLRKKLEYVLIHGFEDLDNMELYFGEFHVVSDQQKLKRSDDITASERKKMTEMSEQLVKEKVHTREQILELAKYFCAGAVLDWQTYYKNSEHKHSVVSLPTYPYAKKVFWVEIAKASREGSEDERQQKIVLLGDKEFSENEITISRIIGNVLNLDELNVYNSFIDLGGNSIVAVKLALEMRKEGFEISAHELLSDMNVRQIAEMYDEKKSEHSRTVTPESTTVDVQEQIEGIEPFREFVYKGCFYSALFPIVKKYNRNIIRIIANEIMTYGFVEEGNMLSLTVNYEPMLNLKHCLQDMGVYFNNRMKCKDIVHELKASIKKKKPVIICIDCYFSSIRKDMYQKQHWPHNLLVYGFDEEKECFQIIEHRNKESMGYQKMTMQYEDLKKAYEGYFKEYSHYDNLKSNFYDDVFDEKKEFPSYYEFELKEENNLGEEEEKRYIRDKRKFFMAEHKDKIQQSFQNLRKFAEEFMELTGQEEKLNEHCEEIVTILNKIVNHNITLSYIQQQLYAEDKHAETVLREANTCWQNIRNVLTRYFYAKSYSIQWADKTRDEIAEAFAYEEKIEAIKEYYYQ